MVVNGRGCTHPQLGTSHQLSDSSILLLLLCSGARPHTAGAGRSRSYSPAGELLGSHPALSASASYEPLQRNEPKQMFERPSSRGVAAAAAALRRAGTAAAPSDEWHGVHPLEC